MTEFHSAIRTARCLLAALLLGGLALAARAQQPGTGDSRLDFTVITPEQLAQSLQLGTDFMLRHQQDDGNFGYLYDFVKRKPVTGQDSSVRQAGTLWSLAVMHRRQPDKRVAEAVYRGVEYWSRCSRIDATSGGLYPVYPGEDVGKTGTVALIVLTLTETLRQPEHLTPEMRRRYTVLLEQYAIFLLSLRQDDGHFYGTFNAETGKPEGFPSPYSCGEALLALIKVCKYLNRPNLQAGILESAETMYANYVQQALARDPDSDITKGFFQWSLMFMHELYTTDWDPELRRKWGERAIDLGVWMIDVHKVLLRTRNTGYAYEGLIVAGDIARRMDNEEAWVKLRVVSAVGMTRLASWQVGGPIPSSFLRRLPSLDPIAIGGVMNADDDPVLRIDTTQHQMHAVALMLDLVVPELTGDAAGPDPDVATPPVPPAAAPAPKPADD